MVKESIRVSFALLLLYHNMRSVSCSFLHTKYYFSSITCIVMMRIRTRLLTIAEAAAAAAYKFASQVAGSVAFPRTCACTHRARARPWSTAAADSNKQRTLFVTAMVVYVQLTAGCVEGRRVGPPVTYTSRKPGYVMLMRFDVGVQPRRWLAGQTSLAGECRTGTKKNAAESIAECVLCVVCLRAGRHAKSEKVCAEERCALLVRVCSLVVINY